MSRGGQSISKIYSTTSGTCAGEGQMKIEHNVPLPNARKFNKYPFLKNLKVGDSFVVENYAMAVNMYIPFKRLGYGMAMRKAEEGNRLKVKYRLWRIK
jgi:hypothetical protein